VDIKGARLWKGCKSVQEMGLTNVAFIRTKIELIGYFFDRDEIDEIWLTFPDPQPKASREMKRLSSPVFLEKYRSITAPGAVIHLKTDNDALYHYTLGVVAEHRHKLLFSSDDIYKLEKPHPATAIQTFYEAKYQKEGIPIKYAEFILSDES
jgi:tRNA (guanine-N7-)-methyltransferase